MVSAGISGMLPTLRRYWSVWNQIPVGVAEYSEPPVVVKTLRSAIPERPGSFVVLKSSPLCVSDLSNLHNTDRKVTRDALDLS